MAAVTLVLLVGLGVLLALYTDDLVARLVPRPDSAWLLPLWWLGVVAVALLAYVVGALTLPPLALTPLSDPLSELAEEACGGEPSPPFTLGNLLRGTAAGLKLTLARLLLLAVGLVLLLPLHLIPGLGSLAYSLLATIWSLLGLTAEHVGAPLARHFHPTATVFRLLRERTALCLGFGAAVQVVLLVPVINAFFLPLAIVGGTLLYLGLVRAGALPSRHAD